MFRTPVILNPLTNGKNLKVYNSEQIGDISLRSI